MIISGTGHRPKYCPCKYKENHPWLLDLKKELKLKLQDIKPTAVVSGMAIGFDTWLAQVALELKIPLHCYIPFPNQQEKWPTDSREEYERILSKSSKQIILSKRYISEAFLIRDRAMVDDADIIFSLLNPEVKSGGTFYTVNYAKEKNKKVINFWRD